MVFFCFHRFIYEERVFSFDSDKGSMSSLDLNWREM